MNVMEEVKKYRDYAIAMRREFHRHPELSWQEVNTAALIRKELDKMGIPYEEVVGTGTIATIKGKKEHPVIGLRCDIDALPIKEVKDLPFRSENEGVMHACGHDGHMSMLLTAARVLADHKDELECTVKLIFQPAEEKTNGAVKVLGEKGLVKYAGTPGGEDFAYFLEAFPGVYAFVGCRNEAKDCCYSLHHERFDLDENALVNGAAFYVQYLLDAQKEFA